mmetsp:Transcript_22143/g.32238  ORF Transcript_22143/g.32238 Transcript_22143/m.32238 type:complete len:262 (-) Transcript_22143:120-905(-)|eukprot:CAMPEP_0185020278 /NCGR_PEP_ID=MMETSP1103-20130426/2878_1 /TAXON_ID=36769 /ORGANISM="Paraphysomonas bandaiensis, Strain Caron Lab Isolate" /LENGTH=261 /DNA_ID=CAMNT_0027551079 /DNA_START=56 /DNA_END=841 /DNA_ORIENTATION=-
MARFLICFLLSVAYASPLAKLQSHHSNTLLPKYFDSIKLSPSKSTLRDASPSGYFIANLYYSGDTCVGEADIVMGTGTDVCFIGFQNNTAVGSLIYTLGSVDDNIMVINYDVYFDSFNCSGISTSGSFNTPTSCVPSDADNAAWSYSYTSNSTPWKDYENGVMLEFYDTANHCSESGLGGMFAWYKLNACISTTSDDGSQGAFSFVACGWNKFTMYTFSDLLCSNYMDALTTNLVTCKAEENDDDDLTPYNYVTYTCSASA